MLYYLHLNFLPRCCQGNHEAQNSILCAEDKTVFLDSKLKFGCKSFFFYWPSGSGQPLAPTCRLTVCTLSVIHGLAYFLPLLWVLSRFTALLHILLLLVQVSSWLEIRLGLPKLLTLQRCQPFGGVSASQVHQKPDVEQLAS